MRILVGNGLRKYPEGIPSVSEICGSLRTSEENRMWAERANEIGRGVGLREGESTILGEYLDTYADRGTALHNMIRSMYVNVQVESCELSQQWSSWWVSKDIKPVMVEVPLMIPDYPHEEEVYRYAGTPDMVAVADGKHVVIDWKTGAPKKWHRMQAAAYAMLVERGGRVPEDGLGYSWSPVNEAWLVYVKKSGVSVQVINEEKLSLMVSAWESCLSGWFAMKDAYSTRLSWQK